MTVGIVRHCQNSRASAKLERRTDVLRSIVLGTNRVHRRLNAGRAIMLCCTANRPSSSTLTTSALVIGAVTP